MIREPLAAGILGRAITGGTLDVEVHDLRDFTTDRHRVVDDVPYGGGPAMVLKPDPIFRALDTIKAARGTPLTVILTSPQGRRFMQAEARRLSRLERFVPGVVGDEQSVADDSFSRGLLDFPQFTRPAEVVVDGTDTADSLTMRVPDILLSGNH